jgi:hypothetical protein
MQVNSLLHFSAVLFFRKNIRFCLGKRLVGPEAFLDALWKREESSVSPGSEPKFGDCPAHSIVI